MADYDRGPFKGVGPPLTESDRWQPEMILTKEDSGLSGEEPLYEMLGGFPGVRETTTDAGYSYCRVM